MTLHAVTVPKWGLAMEEGTLTSWAMQEGATVNVGDEIAEIETSKIANVLEAQAGGVLRRRVAQEGDIKPVGALLGVLADGSEDDTAIDAFIAAFEAGFAAAEKETSSKPTAETIEVNGVPLRFLKVASQSAPPQTPLLLIHGFGGDHLNWMFNQAELAADRDVYALDLPGHGGSTKDVGDGSLAHLAQITAAWLAALELKQVHLVGHSMGAGVALNLALAQPDVVQSLTAICGAGFGGRLNRDYVERFWAAQRRKDLKPVAELLFANPELVTREMLDDLINYKRIDGTQSALRQLIDHALADDSLAALAVRLGELQAPLLAIYGARDHVSVTQAQIDVPGEAWLVENAGHMPHLEAAEAANQKIGAFISKHD
jgi:pyruvate dehydrogenase E2 component (dihydrolipoamide acetyltransferase)